MSYKIQRVDYYYTTVKDQPGESYQLLDQLAEQGVNLLAFSAVPTGPASTQLTIFPENSGDLENLAKKTGLTLLGPHPAFMVNGIDRIGALTDIHKLLYQVNVNVYSSNAIANNKESFGYLIYVRHDDYERAAEALGL